MYLVPVIQRPTMKRPILKAIWLCGCCLLVGTAASAQQGSVDLGARLMKQPSVASAVRMADGLEPWVIDQQIALCEVPAPPFAEKARAEVYRQAFIRHGLSNVRIDAVGNVVGERPGTGAGPHLVFSAH